MTQKRGLYGREPAGRDRAITDTHTTSPLSLKHTLSPILIHTRIHTHTHTLSHLHCCPQVPVGPGFCQLSFGQRMPLLLSKIAFSSPHRP